MYPIVATDDKNKATKNDSVFGFSLKLAIDKKLTKAKFKRIERVMERLRKNNEILRESGVYWHHSCKETVRDLLGKKKTR